MKVVKVKFANDMMINFTASFENSNLVIKRYNYSFGNIDIDNLISHAIKMPKVTE